MSTRAMAGAIPLRLREGSLEVLLVTSRWDGSWTIPLGGVDGAEPRQAAVAEAYEAAGVRGPVGETPLGRFDSTRRRGVVEVFALRAVEEPADYPQRGKRRREWLPQAEAAARAHPDDLGRLIAGLRLEDCPPEAPPVESPPHAHDLVRPRGDPPVVCLDVDETIVEKRGDDEPLPCAVAAVEVLAARGCRVVISTARLDPVWDGSPRAGKITASLRRCGFPFEGVFGEVPAADLYVDDKGFHFSGDWSATLEQVRGRLRLGRDKYRRRISVALVGALRGQAEGPPVPGAVEALAALREQNVQVVISLGNFRPGPEGEPRLDQAKAWLQSHGVPHDRVHPGKVSSDLYVDAHGFSFAGDWSEALPRVLARLGLREDP